MNFVRHPRVRAFPFVTVAALVFAAAFAAPGLTTPAHAGGSGDEIIPSGTVRTETRQPGSFSRVAVGGPFDVEIRQGTREAVTLTADDNVLPSIETVLEGSGADATLKVRLRKDTVMRSKPHIVLVVELVHVDAIALGGVGDVVAKGLRSNRLEVALGGIGRIDLASLDTDDLTVTLGGNGRIKVAGRAARTKISLAGTGICDTDGLAANDVAVTIAGSGDAHVRADRSLKITIAGSGNVVYRGDATLSTTVIGSGRVTKG